MSTSKESPPIYLDRKEVEKRCAISCTQIYRLMRAKQFPAAYRLSGNCVRWLDSEITEWQITRPRTVEV